MLYWHTGGLIGGGSYVLLCPEIKWGLTFFANVQDASARLKGLAVELLDAALGIPEEERTERTTVDKQAVKLFEKIVAEAGKAREKLCPSSPDTPTLPLALPLQGYTGTFGHAGYGSLTFVAEKDADGKDCLVIDLTNRTWRNKLVLHHVNAESWLVTRSSASSPYEVLVKAESKVAADGRVSWGIAMEPAMPGVLTWFTKVE